MERAGKMGLRGFAGLLKQAFSDWLEDRGPRLGAAVAFYTIFSLSPLLIIVMAIVGLAFEAEAAHRQIFDQVRGMVGDTGAAAIEGAVESAAEAERGIFASIVAVVVLIVGATVVFAELQDALNKIWDVKPEDNSARAGILRLVRTRLLSFAMVLGIGFLLLVSLVVSAGLSAAMNYISGFAPAAKVVSYTLNFVVPFLVITMLFAMIFKFMPDVRIAWRDVWIGAALTSFLFSVGKTVIGLYLGHSGVASAYGAAGSFVVVLIWVYYSAQILFFGAEFTQAYARKYGSHVT